MAETTELVARAKGGDHAAFAALYDRHARLVKPICYDSTAHLASAEDLSQEVFLRTYQKLHQLRDGTRFVAWLCEIARRAGRDREKKSRRDGGQPNLEQTIDVAVPQEEPQLAELRHAIRQLPDHERMALHLFYLDEQPVAVARQVLRLSQSGFYKLLDRAREHAGSIMRSARVWIDMGTRESIPDPATRSSSTQSQEYVDAARRLDTALAMHHIDHRVSIDNQHAEHNEPAWAGRCPQAIIYILGTK